MTNFESDQSQKLTSDVREEAKAIFLDSIEIAEADREKFLDQSCGDNAQLMAEVQSLLATHGNERESILKLDFGKVIVAELRTTCDESPDENVVGRFRLGRELGSGGCAVVYHARQTEPVNRDVAIKMLKPNLGRNKTLLDRFRFEQRTQALMSHPNIARVLDAGETKDGQPFLVMEFVDGMRITSYCDGHRLSIEERLRLFLSVCFGVQHAHQKAIVHRDLKPSNVLVATIDNEPTPKVIDFGVAKAIGEIDFANADVTQAGQLLGSPAYMSPEQIETNRDIDTRSDVYSLGVLLYELLSGKHPADSKDIKSLGFSDLSELIKTNQPRNLSDFQNVADDEISEICQSRRADEKRLRTVLQNDLNWIVMKCLEKDRERRYASANGLAADIQRFLDNEPVVAGPPSTSYRISKFVKRNRRSVIAASLVSLAVLLGLVGTSVGMYQAFKAKELAILGKQIAIAESVRANEVGRLVKETFHNVAIESRASGGKHLFILKHALDSTSKRIDQGELKDEITESKLRFVLGQAYSNLGFYEESESEARKCVDIEARLLGTENTDYLDSKSLLAGALRGQEKFDEAIEIRRSIHDQLLRICSPMDVSIVHSFNNLAMTYVAAGQSEKAFGHYDSALEECRKRLPPDSNEELSIRYNYGSMLMGLEKHDQATIHFTQLLASEERVRGEHHPRTMRARLALAENFRRNKQNDAALDIAIKMCEIDVKLKQPHPHRLQLLMYLRYDNGEYLCAKECANMAIAVCKESDVALFERYIKKCDDRLAEEEVKQNNDGVPNERSEQPLLKSTEDEK